MSSPPITPSQPNASGVATRALRLPSGPDLTGFVAAGAAVVITCASNGSYFSTSWGWEALVLLALSITGLTFMRTVRVFRLQALFLAALTAFVTWIGLSSLWSESVPSSVREVERDIVYVSLALSLAVFGRYLSSRGLALGALAGTAVITGYALATRLFPLHFAPPDPNFDYQLAVPLGYWNALGLLSAMGLIVSIGVAAHDQARTVRMLAGAATCVIAPAMLFTFSRGAWAAVVVGFVVMFALDPRRVGLTGATAALAGPIAVLVWLGVTSSALTVDHSVVAAQEHSGRRYLVAVIVLGCLAAVLTEIAHRVVARLDPGRAAERRLLIAIVAAILIAGLGLVAVAGGPVKAADRSWSAFAGRYSTTSDNLSERYLSLSDNGRAEYWRVAVVDSRNHPVLGSGAGTYEQIWYGLRKNDLAVRDAHSLYLEVLAELGPVGLLLLGCALATPLVGFARARSVAHVPAAGGAFVAYAVHAGFDWDWEVVGLTVTAILIGTVGLVAVRDRSFPVVHRVRFLIAGAAVLAAGFAFLSFAGNRELAASRRTLSAGEFALSALHAHNATRSLSWAVEPWIALGDAQRSRGDRQGARSSYEHALVMDPDNWRIWLALADVSTGAERQRAEERRELLNPRYNPALG